MSARRRRQVGARNAGPDVRLLIASASAAALLLTASAAPAREPVRLLVAGDGRHRLVLRDGFLHRFDARCRQLAVRRVVGFPAVSGPPALSLAAGAGHVAVAGAGSLRLMRASDLTPTGEVRLSRAGPWEVAYSAGRFWAWRRHRPTLTAVGPDGTVATRRAFGVRITAVATDGRRLWVAGASGVPVRDRAIVAEIDVRSGRIVRSIGVPSAPTTLRHDGARIVGDGPRGRLGLADDLRSPAMVERVEPSVIPALRICGA